MKNCLVIFLLFALLLSACGSPQRDSGLAQDALESFFEQLSKGNYAEAAALYGGSYETLVAMNPDLDPDDTAALWQNGCQVNGLQCLGVRSAAFKELTPGGEYLFAVQFSTPGGSRFQRGACCGEEPSTPPVFEFQYRVVKGGDGVFRVLDMPVYIP